MLDFNKEEYLCFDDVLISPKAHREDFVFNPEIKCSLPGISIPIFASPMDTISGTTMLTAMYQVGARAVYHRYMEDYTKWTLSCIDDWVAIGTTSSKKSKEYIDFLLFRGNMYFVMDVAHGASKKALDTIKYIKRIKPTAYVIAGNVADITSLNAVYDAGADGVRLGIGSGSKCTTRIHTGIGVPQLSVIDMAYKWKLDYQNGIPRGLHRERRSFLLISDGGINNYGDVCKAFAAGADMIMTGKLFAGCNETPGPICAFNNWTQKYEEAVASNYMLYSSVQRYKLYRGMASEDARKNYRIDDSYPEGESVYVECTNKSAKDIVNEIVGYLKQAFFYVGANNLEEFRRNATLIRISSNSKTENGIRI